MTQYTRPAPSRVAAWASTCRSPGRARRRRSESPSTRSPAAHWARGAAWSSRSTWRRPRCRTAPRRRWAPAPPARRSRCCGRPGSPGRPRTRCGELGTVVVWMQPLAPHTSKLAGQAQTLASQISFASRSSRTFPQFLASIFHIRARVGQGRRVADRARAQLRARGALARAALHTRPPRTRFGSRRSGSCPPAGQRTRRCTLRRGKAAPRSSPPSTTTGLANHAAHAAVAAVGLRVDTLAVAEPFPVHGAARPHEARLAVDAGLAACAAVAVVNLQIDALVTANLAGARRRRAAPVDVLPGPRRRSCRTRRSASRWSSASTTRPRRMRPWCRCTRRNPCRAREDGAARRAQRQPQAHRSRTPPLTMGVPTPNPPPLIRIHRGGRRSRRPVPPPARPRAPRRRRVSWARSRRARPPRPRQRARPPRQSCSPAEGLAGVGQQTSVELQSAFPGVMYSRCPSRSPSWKRADPPMTPPSTRLAGRRRLRPRTRRCAGHFPRWPAAPGWLAGGGLFRRGNRERDGRRDGGSQRRHHPAPSARPQSASFPRSSA